MERTLVVVTFAAVTLAPIGAAPLMAGASATAAALHDCRGMATCEHQGQDPLAPLPCTVVTVACVAPAMVDDPFSLRSSDPNGTATPALGRSLHTQHTTSVRTPPPRS